MGNQQKGRNRDIANTQEKITQSQLELRRLQRKTQMSEGEKIQNLDRKISNTDYKCRELQREIKMLKKLQHDQGNELVGLDIKEDYPEKIRGLLEEAKWAKDKQFELQDKLDAEERHLKRQREQL